jgi:hypothetical protein
LHWNLGPILSWHPLHDLCDAIIEQILFLPKIFLNLKSPNDEITPPG